MQSGVKRLMTAKSQPQPQQGVLEGSPVMVEPEVSRKTVDPTYSLVDKHAKRLGVDSNTAMNNLMDFASIVGEIESNNNLTAKNVPQAGKEASSASGKYQFVDGSIEPAINRLERTTGMMPWMKELLVHRDVTRLDDEQQTMLFLGEMLEKKGSDQHMKGIMESGNTDDMLQAYYKLHHTNPDVATKSRATDVLAKYTGSQGV